MTSHDVINQLRRILSVKQIGHSGTLDPMAEGVMVVGVGKATRLLQYVPDDKTYLAGILLGRTTDTDDIEGKVLSECDNFDNLDQELIKKRLTSFVGKQMQVPPLYSAIKKGGVKMYELARKGEAPGVIEARPVEIYCLELLFCQIPNLVVRVACSKGTYIRAIARDLGQGLGVGGCLSSLVRESVGNLRVEQSVRLSSMQNRKKTARREPGESQTESIDHEREILNTALIDPALALQVQTLDLEAEQAKKLAHGQSLRLIDCGKMPENLAQSYSNTMLIACNGGRSVALVSLRDETIKPEVVLVDANQV